MIRTLLASTAIATLLTAGVFAQDATTPATDAPAAAPEVTTETTVEAPTSILASGYTITDVDNLATEIIGRQVYSSEAADAEHIGDVNNLVIGENGDVAAVVIGVGGFLGIGEKNVAVNYSELQWVVADDNTERFILPTSKEALEQAPDFRAEDQTRPTEDNVAPATNDAAAPVAPSADPAPVDNNAMAPADNANAMAPVTGPIDRTTLTDAPLTAEELIGTNAYGPADEHLGAIGDVILGKDGTAVEGVVIDFGGFLGIGTKPVALAIDNLRYATDANNNKYLFLNVTREQLDQAPAYDANTFEANRDAQIVRTDAL